MKTMKAELDRRNTELSDASAEQNRLQSEVNHCKAEFLDVQRSQRATKVDLEQATKKVKMMGVLIQMEACRSVVLSFWVEL